MRRQLIYTFILLAAAIAITVVYFRNLNLPGKHPNRVIQTIPNDALLIFEFNNDGGFYDIFKGNTMLPAITGQQQMNELAVLRQQLLLHPALKDFFDEQNIYISLHNEANGLGFLFTSSVKADFKLAMLDDLSKKTRSGMLINAITVAGKPGYNIYFSDLKKRFFLVYKGDHIFSGSFSKDLLTRSAQYVPMKDKQEFTLLPDQQNSNSLANIYLNYQQLNPLTQQLFISKNNDIFKSFRSMSAFAALTLNYKSDALMFSGFTTLQPGTPDCYLSIFRNQMPVKNQLKDVFPSSTAYSTTFSVSDVKKFTLSLADFHNKAGLNAEQSELFKKIKSETGILLRTEFNNLLSNEFAVVTTRYQEKLGLITIKNGSQLRPFMVNISNMVDDDIGQFKYTKIAYFLLGDAFSLFGKPYFMIIDNYLVIANTPAELKSYKESYINHKLLSKIKENMEFDDLIAGQSNVTFFIQFKNALPLFKREMKPETLKDFESGPPGWRDYYAASYQLSASDKDFYTTFCMKMNKKDSLVINSPQ